jgi:hypothetical protein
VIICLPFYFYCRWLCGWNATPDFKFLSDEDVDVANERKRINDKQTQNDVLVVDNLTKVSCQNERERE